MRMLRLFCCCTHGLDLFPQQVDLLVQQRILLLQTTIAGSRWLVATAAVVFYAGCGVGVGGGTAIGHSIRTRA